MSVGFAGVFLFFVFFLTFNHHVPWSTAAVFSQKMFIFIEPSLSVTEDVGLKTGQFKAKVLVGDVVSLLISNVTLGNINVSALVSSSGQ